MLWQHTITLIMEIKIAPIMTKTHNICSPEISPCPIEACQFAVAAVFITYIVTSIIAYHSQINIVLRLTHMNGEIRQTVHYHIFFMATNQNLCVYIHSRNTIVSLRFDYSEVFIPIILRSFWGILVVFSIISSSLSGKESFSLLKYLRRKK